MHLSLGDVAAILGIVIVLSALLGGAQVLISRDNRARPSSRPNTGLSYQPSRSELRVLDRTASAWPARDLGPRIFTGDEYLHTGPLVAQNVTQVDGREQIIGAMQQALNDDWTIFCDVPWRGQHSAGIPVVLTGPGGIWAFKVKGDTRGFRVYKGIWYREGAPGSWTKDKAGPAAEAHDNAVWLSNYLTRCGVTRGGAVTGVLIATGAPDCVSVSTSGPAQVWDLATLQSKLQEMRALRVVPPPQVEISCMALERLFMNVDRHKPFSL